MNTLLDDKIETAYDYIHNNTPHALSLFNEILEKHPKNLDALNGKASALIKLKELNQAEEVLRQSLSIKENSSAYINLGIINKNKKQYQKALDNFDKAIELNPKLVDVVIILKKEIIECLGLNNNLINLGHYNKQANQLIFKGLNYEKEGQYWDAVECYEYALEKDPTTSNFVEALINKIKINLQNEFLFDEITYDDTSISLLKRKVLTAIFTNENPKFALKLINDALKIDPIDLDMLNYKGALEFYFENYEEAINCFDKCLDVNSEYSYALFNKGLVFRRLKRYQDALICFDKVLENHENYDKVKPYQSSILKKLVKTY